MVKVVKVNYLIQITIPPRTFHYFLTTKGMSQLSFYVNKPPENGACNLLKNETVNPR